jgi:hypothetical protein
MYEHEGLFLFRGYEFIYKNEKLIISTDFISVMRMSRTSAATDSGLGLLSISPVRFVVYED